MNKALFDSIWIEKYRPKTLEDVVLAPHDRVFFESLQKKKDIPHLLFAGNPGTGKTSLGKIITTDILQANYLYINASDENGIDTIRGKIVGFAKTASFDGNTKVVLLDETDGLSSSAQDALRNTIEEFSATNRFILTCNYLHKITKPIQSRCQIVVLVPPVDGVVSRIVKILKAEKISISEEQKPLLLKHIQKNLPDLRRIINDIQKFSIDGSLQIRATHTSDFAEEVFTKIKESSDPFVLRKFLIDNEKEFSNDYRQLQRELFDVVFGSDLDSELKATCLLHITRGLEMDAFVVDKEINCFSCMLNLHRSIHA